MTRKRHFKISANRKEAYGKKESHKFSPAGYRRSSPLGVEKSRAL